MEFHNGWSENGSKEDNILYIYQEKDKDEKEHTLHEQTYPGFSG